MTTETTVPEVNPWHDDLLDRKKYADFLSNYIESKVQPDKPGMVMALDAPWGLGKTFFVTRWADQLRAQKRAVVVFDAWLNDSAEDPTISFMAALRTGLKPVIERLPVNNVLVRTQIKEKSSALIGKLRKATISTAKVIGTGVLKKTTGIAINDLMNAVASDLDAEDRTEEQLEAADSGHPSQDIIDKGLDDFFEKALEGQTERLKAVRDFRQSLQDILEALREAQVMDGPLYVFVDELDRCRPNYAINLLEGVKHLFSVQGVVFVVSTNLDQLSKAMGAVYGPSFDGFLYLKRFFDFEYELPEPTRINFIKSQIAGTRTAEIELYSGLDTRLSDRPSDVAHGFAAVSEAMRLDLRSLGRILTSTEAVIASLPQQLPIACLWLFFLTALKYRYNKDFQAVATHNLNLQQFSEMCNRIFVGPKMVTGLTFDKTGDFTRRPVTGQYPLSDALATYYRATAEDAVWIRNYMERSDPYSAAYPSFLVSTLYERWPTPRRDGPHQIDTYANLVAMAGHVG